MVIPLQENIADIKLDTDSLRHREIQRYGHQEQRQQQEQADKYKLFASSDDTESGSSLTLKVCGQFERLPHHKTPTWVGATITCNL